MIASPSCHLLIERTGAGRQTESPRDEIRVFARCRNERLRLPAFFRHYRTLGAGRFFVVDNGSSDGTTDYLAAQSDVRLFRTTNRYREARSGLAWLNALLAEFGVGFWCVTVDIDELLVFPGSEQTSLRTLTAYLDQRGHDALTCMLLDMYPGTPLDGSSYTAGEDLIAAAPYFDLGPYDRTPFDECPGFLIMGGARERLFHPAYRTRGRGARMYHALFNRVLLRTPIVRENAWIRRLRLPSPPALSKVPLVRWDSGSRYLKSAHGISTKTVAPEMGVLLHFKLLHDLHAKAIQEAERGEYSRGALEYKRYARTLDQNPRTTFMYEGSVRFESTSQLVRLGLMQDSEAWTEAREQAQREIGTTP
jgi:Glycosyl transferase family 2